MKLIPEWYDHERCLIAWPCNLELYGSQIHSARKEISNLANQLAEEEPVYIYCNSQDIKDCRLTVSNQKISIIEVNLDDSWMRDIAPIFYKEEQQLKSINFNFNGYGKYPNYKNDNLLSDIICDQFKIPYKNSSITLEGHIDNIFCPIGNDQYLIASTKDNTSKNYYILQEAKELVEEYLSKLNPKIEIIEIPLPGEIEIDNKVLVASYINFYFCKNSLLVPKFNVDEDLEVYDIFQSLFPSKKIKMIETSNINYGGGNIHCVTMNMPKI